MSEQSQPRPDGHAAAIEAVGALAEPTRHRLYDWVVGERRAVGRDEAARALGIGRPLAAFHLDRLAEAGLLSIEFRRLSGRSGPGAGRPAKLYRRADGDVSVSLPERRYELAASLFAEGIEAGTADEAGGAVAKAVEMAAARRGRMLGDEARRRAGTRPTKRRLRESMLAVLDENGYAPREIGREIRFTNCPFDALVEEHRPLMCSANVALAAGLVSVVDPAGLNARLDQRPGLCCVAISSAVKGA